MIHLYMAKIFRIISLLLLITNFAYSDVFKEKYIVGQKVQNLIGLDKIQIRLSKGQWEVVESGRWSYNAFSGKNLGLVKLRNNEIVETLSLGYIDTAGKRMSDIDSYFYEVFFTDPYDGCYKRPEYYKVELYHKGATFNCFLICFRILLLSISFGLVIILFSHSVFLFLFFVLITFFNKFFSNS